MAFTLWFMGRPAAGKSTIAKRVESILRERGFDIENLDGDDIRQNLHPELGFTKADRAINNRRTAYICKLLNENGINVVNAMITPFRESQQEASEIIEPEGEFALIYVKCSLDEAIRRDPKGLYEKAQDGKITNFTGIDHPFQEPHDPDIVVDSETEEIEIATQHVLDRLHQLDFLEQPAPGAHSFELDVGEKRDIEQRLKRLGYLEDE